MPVCVCLCVSVLRDIPALYTCSVSVYFMPKCQPGVCIAALWFAWFVCVCVDWRLRACACVCLRLWLWLCWLSAGTLFSSSPSVWLRCRVTLIPLISARAQQGRRVGGGFGEEEGGIHHSSQYIHWSGTHTSLSAWFLFLHLPLFLSLSLAPSLTFALFGVAVIVPHWVSCLYIYFFIYYSDDYNCHYCYCSYSFPYCHDSTTQNLGCMHFWLL